MEPTTTLSSAFQIVKHLIGGDKPYSVEEKAWLKKLIVELNKLVLIVQFGPHLNEDCYYLRFSRVGEKEDYEQYLNIFERHVCFNPSFPNGKIREIFNDVFFSNSIFKQYRFMSTPFGEGQKTPSGCVMIMDGSEDFSLEFKYFPEKFKTFREFYCQLVELKEAVEAKGKIRFK